MNTYKNRLESLRDLIRRAGLLGYIVPHADAYQGEFLPPSEERLAWLTGFTGSAGVGVILLNKAFIFSDSRYTLQILREVDATLFEGLETTAHKPADYTATQVGQGGRLGYDPFMHTVKDVREWRDAGLTLVPLEDNLVDKVWTDRPLPPAHPLVSFPLTIAGRNAENKIQVIAQKVQESGAQAALISSPESVAWLLNVRGSDIPCVPVARARALVYAAGDVDLFVENLAQRGPLPPLPPCVKVKDGRDFGAFTGALMLDSSHAPFALAHLAKDVIEAQDPCLLPRSVKTKEELKAIRDAHKRDGVALVRFLAALATKNVSTECQLTQELAHFRCQDSTYRGPSFPTICGFGENGAIIHYHAHPGADAPVRAPGLLLLDSGGQYPGGTTDVTRTLAIGTPTLAQKTHYTLVLKAHITLALQRFPRGTKGVQLDAITRAPLWSAGLDYAHGTGHGVGCALCVHEGPVSLSTRAGEQALLPGMVLSNEPGYYKPGAYGIRIESLMAVVEMEPDWLGFDVLTLAPMERALIVPHMLSSAERAFLNLYHKKVFDILNQELDAQTSSWLLEMTRVI